MTRFAVLVLVVSIAVAITAQAVGAATESDQAKVPVIAIHIEKRAPRNCDDLPVIDKGSLRTTYDGVGEIDAFVVLFTFKEAKGMSFGMNWPEAWGRGTWNDCSHLKIADIAMPGDVTSLVWKECISDSLPMIVGWLTLTVNSPGTIEVVPAPNEGAIAVADCNEIAVQMSEAILSLKAGAGGAKGDDVAKLHTISNRNWYIGPNATGDAPSINEAMRQALPGDTVFVAGGLYHEKLQLRGGVVILGSWDKDHKVRDFSRTPSIIEPAVVHDEGHEESGHSHDIHHSVVAAAFGEDSTTVLDGFIIRGGSGKFGGGIALRNGASPLLRNLIIHSNSAQFGAGIACHGASPVIRDVLIARNKAGTGGAIFCSTGSSPRLVNVTIVDNEADVGAAVCLMRGSSPYIEKCIIAYHADGHALFNSDTASLITFACCDLWSNHPSDFSPGAEELALLRDNLADDPQFTDPDNMDYTLKPGSPLLSSSGCGRMGSKHGRIPKE